MKSLILILLLSSSSLAAEPSALTPTDTISAPVPKEDHLIHLTPFIGISFSTFVGDDTGGLETRTRIAAGGLFEWGIAPGAIETGLVYRQMGVAGSGKNMKYEIDLSYLSIPIMAKYYFSTSTRSSAFVKGGLVPMYLADKSATIRDAGISRVTTDVKVNDYDIGLSVGIGLTAPLASNATFVTEATYFRGLQRINTTGEGSIYNSGGLITAGVAMGL